MKTIRELLINITINEIIKEYDKNKISEKNKKILQGFSKLKNNKKYHQDQAILQLIDFKNELGDAFETIKKACIFTNIIKKNS